MDRAGTPVEGAPAPKGTEATHGEGERWREVVRLLEDNARARHHLEAIEAELLVEAQACEVPTRLGYRSLEEFMERHLGYGRHAAAERVRVACALRSLPQLRTAFDEGTLSFSHVRELTRVATPQTEGAYLAAAQGKTSRQVQQMVSGKRAGDAPDAPPDPALVKHTVVLELGGEAYAMWRRTQQVLEEEVGEHLTSDELVIQLCTQALAPALCGTTSAPEAEAPAVDPRGAPSPGTAPVDQGQATPDRRPPRRRRLAASQTLLAVATCRRCHHATASAVGSAEPLTRAQQERASCDALRVGDLESNDRTRPTLTIPAAIRRKVAIACNHACVVPGCRSRRYLEVHHLRSQEHGGAHTVENCGLLCRFHHQRLHEGRLRIEGTAPHALEVAWRHPSTDAEQDGGAGPWVWRSKPPGPTRPGQRR